MKTLIAGLSLAGLALANSASFAQPAKPTIVLVHGAFADASSWDGVIKILEKDGYTVVAAANPLRSVKGDSAYVADILSSIKTPVVLVGHSYGGMVISQAAAGNANVKGLVFVDAFAPEAGESGNDLAGKFPGGTLAPAIAPPVALSNGEKDLYIKPDKFHAQFAADVPAAEAKVMAATQRPIAASALDEKATAPAWKTIPSWFVYGESDKNIPPEAHAFMAKRAASKETVAIKGASHVAMVSHPEPVAKLIKRAAEQK